MRTLASELGSHVDASSEAPRIYVDANVPAGVVRYMRRRLSWDVFFVMEHEDLRRAADETHYQVSRRLHRILITMDRDFLDERRFPLDQSGGVIVVHAPDERGLNRVLKRLHEEFFVSEPLCHLSLLVGKKLDLHPDSNFGGSLEWLLDECGN